MKVLVVLFLLLPIANGICQSKYSISIGGGLSNLFEAEIANESSGTFLGMTLERKISKLSLFVSYEKISCQNGAIDGISQFSFNGGPWMISDYKGYINLERRDWAFDDVSVDERLFSAGQWNYPGNEQTFDSNNIIIGIGYDLWRKGIFSITPKVGLATSLVHVSAVNLIYTTSLNGNGKQYNVAIPAYLKYLYFSSYIAVPFQFDITQRFSASIVGSLYRTTNLYLSSLGISIKSQL
jgi:hypothetical protein